MNHQQRPWEISNNTNNRHFRQMKSIANWLFAPVPKTLINEFGPNVPISGHKPKHRMRRQYIILSLSTSLHPSLLVPLLTGFLPIKVPGYLVNSNLRLFHMQLRINLLEVWEKFTNVSMAQIQLRVHKVGNLFTANGSPILISNILHFVPIYQILQTNKKKKERKIE